MNLDRLKQAQEAFLHRYPAGFENAELKAIRHKKHKPDLMIALAQESFSKRTFQRPELIAQNMEKVISHRRFSFYPNSLPSPLPPDF